MLSRISPPRQTPFAPMSMRRQAGSQVGLSRFSDASVCFGNIFLQAQRTASVYVSECLEQAYHTKFVGCLYANRP